MSTNPVAMFGDAPLVGSVRASGGVMAHVPPDPQLAAYLGQRPPERNAALTYSAHLAAPSQIRTGWLDQDFATALGASKVGTAAAGAAIGAARGDSTEMRWLTENARALETFRGEWLLIVGSQLVAHSADFTAIRRAIAERNVESPFVYYVPTTDEANFVAV